MCSPRAAKSYNTITQSYRGAEKGFRSSKSEGAICRVNSSCYTKGCREGIQENPCPTTISEEVILGWFLPKLLCLMLPLPMANQYPKSLVFLVSSIISTRLSNPRRWESFTDLFSRASLLTPPYHSHLVPSRIPRQLHGVELTS